MGPQHVQLALGAKEAGEPTQEGRRRGERRRGSVEAIAQHDTAPDLR